MLRIVLVAVDRAHAERSVTRSRHCRPLKRSSPRRSLGPLGHYPPPALCSLTGMDKHPHTHNRDFLEILIKIHIKHGVLIKKINWDSKFFFVMPKNRVAYHRVNFFYPSLIINAETIISIPHKLSKKFLEPHHPNFFYKKIFQKIWIRTH
jgi:hypothetical protein